MADHRPSAAQALYGHLPRGTPDVVERRARRDTIANEIFPSLAPRPQPPKNPYLEPMTETEWRDQLWELAGLRRKR
jgi:hypothetical protein